MANKPTNLAPIATWKLFSSPHDRGNLYLRQKKYKDFRSAVMRILINIDPDRCRFQALSGNCQVDC